MPDVTEITPVEVEASLRTQVRQRLKMLIAQKDAFPKALAQLNAVTAREDVRAAFGAEIDAIDAAIKELS